MDGIKGGSQRIPWVYNPGDHRMRMIRDTYKHGEDKYKVLKTMNLRELSILGTGEMGVLTHKAFNAGHFSPTSLLPVSGGFRTTRWLFVENYSSKKKKESVQQVQEFIGMDGEYRQTMLKTISPPPSLPNTDFYIPKFE